MPRHIIAVTSLAREARIARGNGASVVCSQSCRLGAALNGALSPGVCGIISFGISGGLHPELVAGDWVVASAVRYGDRVFATDILDDAGKISYEKSRGGTGTGQNRNTRCRSLCANVGSDPIDPE